MNPYFKALMLVAAIAGLFVSATARADYRDYNDKAWNQPGRASSGMVVRSRPQFRATAPVIVRSEQAPTAVAQAPTEQRSFSYEPSQKAASGVCCCPNRVTPKRAPATAERPMETRRSFSYEPSMGGTDSAPRMRSRSSRTPAYLLPKTDPNKYRGF